MTAALTYSTSTHGTRVLARIAHVAAAGRRETERRAAQARAARERARLLAWAARVEADIRAEFPGVDAFNVKVCDVDAKYRLQGVTIEHTAWLVASIGDVEYWPVGW